MDCRNWSLSGAVMASLKVRVCGSLETAVGRISSTSMEGMTWSGNNDSMEKISLGVSHLVGVKLLEL
jgi:hypothetical protein